MTREEPRVGEIWKHFKNNYYRIICIGHHSETGEKMVVYVRVVDLSDPFYNEVEPCIRPLDMFMSEVDRVKYPNATQQYRFEKVINNT